MLNRAHLLQSCVSPSCWVLCGVTAVMSQFLHTDSNCLVSFYLISESQSANGFRERGFYSLCDLSGFTAATCCIRARPDAPHWIIKNCAFKRYHFALSVHWLSILPASCRLLGEILNSRTLAVVIPVRSSSLLFHFCFPFLNFPFPSPSLTSSPDLLLWFCWDLKTLLALFYWTTDKTCSSSFTCTFRD